MAETAIDKQADTGRWAELTVGEKPVLTTAQATFLAAYEQAGNISAACRAAKVSQGVHYQAMKNNPDYPQLFDHAKRKFVECLETEATRRAVEGVKEPVYQGGKLIGHKMRYSDVLLIFMMKAHHPEKYGDKRETPGHQTHEVNVNIRDMTPDKRQDRLRYLAERAGVEIGMRARN